MTVSAFLLVTLLATSSFADINDITWTKKIKRGLINVVTSPVEIPKQAIGGAFEKPNLIMIFAGFVKGVAYTVGRAGSGFWDILSCNLDISDEPLMKPDYVFEEWPMGESKK